MFRVYSTISGDMWDGIALKTMGSEMHKDRLMGANKKYRHVYIFPADIELVVPETPKTRPAGLPPWKRQR